MMAGEIGVILRHGRLYGLANVAHRGAGLLLVPLYAHVLTPAEFGVYAGLSVLIDLLSAVLGMGLGRALMRLYIDRSSDAERGTLVGTALAAFAMGGGTAALLAYPLSSIASRVLFGSGEHALLIAVSVWELVLTTLVTIALNYLVVRQQSLLYLAIALLKTTCFVAFNLVFLLYWEWGVFGIVIGTLLSSAIMAAVLLAHIAREVRPSFSVPVLRELIAFGGPLVPSVLFDTAMVSLDRAILGFVQGAAPLGLYGLGLRLATALQMFLTSPFVQIWAVRELKSLDGGSADRELPCIYFYFICGLVCFALAISLFAPEIVGLIASEDYAEAASVIPFLVAAQVINAMRSFVEIGLFHAKRTGALPLVGAISLAMAAPVYLVSAHLWGAIGVAAAVAAVAVVRTALAATIADRCTVLLRLFPWGALAAVVGIAIVSFAAGAIAANDASGALSFAAKAAALAFFLAAAAVPVVLVGRSEHRGRAVSVVRDWRRVSSEEAI